MPNLTGARPHNGPSREPTRELNILTGTTGTAVNQKAIFDPATMQTTGGRPMQIDEQRGGLTPIDPEQMKIAINAPVAKNIPFDQPPQHPGTITHNLINPDNAPPQPQPIADVQATPPPPDPGLSQQLLEMQAQLEEMRQQLTRAREYNEDLRFQMDAFGNPVAARPVAPPAQLPQNIDPSAPVTFGDFLVVAQNLFAQVPAQTIRSMWNVTPNEEAAILREYPQAQTLAEPARTQFIQKAVQRARQRAQQGKTQTAPAPSPNPPHAQKSQAQAPARAVTGTVPAPESGGQTASGLNEPQQTNALSEAGQRYQAAQKIRNPKERREAMKDSANELARLQGFSDRGAFARGGFVQRSQR